MLRAELRKWLFKPAGEPIPPVPGPALPQPDFLGVLDVRFRGMRGTPCAG
jgi:hypothetical protein